MTGRLDALADAVNKVKPPLADFSNLLTDERKARFNAIGRASPAATQQEEMKSGGWRPWGRLSRPRSFAMRVPITGPMRSSDAVLAIEAVIEPWKREINKNTKKLIIITMRLGRNEPSRQRMLIASQVLPSKCF
ncbi:MAG: hypothetical protein ACREDT_01010 [Methylocella sp.]